MAELKRDQKSVEQFVNHRVEQGQFVLVTDVKRPFRYSGPFRDGIHGRAVESEFHEQIARCGNDILVQFVHVGRLRAAASPCDLSLAGRSGRDHARTSGHSNLLNILVRTVLLEVFSSYAAAGARAIHCVSYAIRSAQHCKQRKGGGLREPAQ